MADIAKTVLKYAQDVMKGANGSAYGGFNSRIMGHDYGQTMCDLTWGIAETAAGWNLADRMVRAGKLYAVHNFHHSHECRGHAFPYGGTFVCNDCGRSRLEKDWWTIKCYPDGNAWCCVGPDFENLQESDCVAFGDTYDAAIAAYGDLMVSRAIEPSAETVQSKAASTKCAYCDEVKGLRISSDGGMFAFGRHVEPIEYVCRNCFTAADGCPSFDDLPLKAEDGR